MCHFDFPLQTATILSLSLSNSLLVWKAFESLSDGFGKTTSALVRSPLKTFQRGAGAGPALASALRAAPAGAVAPASAVARAFHCTLLGVRNRYLPFSLIFPFWVIYYEQTSYITVQLAHFLH